MRRYEAGAESLLAYTYLIVWRNLGGIRYRYPLKYPRQNF